MADLQAYAALSEGADQRPVSGDLGGDGDDPGSARGAVVLDFLEHRGMGEIGLRAELAGVDAGPSRCTPSIREPPSSERRQ